MIAVYVILIIAAVIMLLSLIPINVIADFAYNSDNNTLYLKFLFIKVRLYPAVEKAVTEYEKKPEKVDKETLDIAETLKRAKSAYAVLKKDIWQLVNYILTRALSIKELNISAVLGTGDPMYTGILYGAANAAVYGALGAADAKMKIKKYHVDIKSDFDNARLAAGIYAVIYTRFVHLYYAAAKAIIIFMKIKKTLREVEENE